MKQKHRYRHKTKGAGLASGWPADHSSDETAERAIYVGSGEHKAPPVDASYDMEAAHHKRSDASRCDPQITREEAEQFLRSAIRQGTVSAEFLGDLPAYVWGMVDGQAYIARLINREAGHYKAWPISQEELPLDREGRIAALRESGND